MMPAIRVVLCRDSLAREIAFTGTVTGGNYQLDIISVPRTGGSTELTLVTPFQGPVIGHLVALDGTGTLFRFEVAVAIAVAFRSELVFGATPPFDASFDITAAVSATIVLRLRTTSAQGASLEIQLRGQVTVGGATSPASFEYHIVLGDLPMSFPSALPRLLISLPELGLNLSDLELPWNLSIPQLPYRWPAASFALDPLPIRVSYRMSELMVILDGGDSKVTVTFRDLNVTAFGPSVEFSTATFTISADGSVKARVQVTKPNLGPLDLPDWHLEPGCLLLWGTGTQMNSLLAWLIPELEGLHLANSATWQLRVLSDLASVGEFRIDVKTSAAETIGLPGFDLTLPTGTALTLLLAETATVPRQWLTVNLPAGGKIVAKSTFAWNNNTDRELLKDQSNPSPLLTLTLAPNAAISVLLLGREDGHLTLFQKANPALTFIDPNDELTRCLPTIAGLPRSSPEISPQCRRWTWIECVQTAVSGEQRWQSAQPGADDYSRRESTARSERRILQV